MKESGVIDKTTMVFGQMNEPPGARMRVALTGLTMAEYFRDRAVRTVLLFHRQYFPFYAGRFRGIGAAWTYAVCGWLPADLTDRDGRASGAYHIDKERFYHIRAGSLCAGGRPDRPGSGDDFRASGCDDRTEGSIVELGIYPAVDPLGSSSRNLIQLRISWQEHFEVARGVQEILQN